MELNTPSSSPKHPSQNPLTQDMPRVTPNPSQPSLSVFPTFALGTPPPNNSVQSSQQTASIISISSPCQGNGGLGVYNNSSGGNGGGRGAATAGSSGNLSQSSLQTVPNPLAVNPKTPRGRASTVQQQYAVVIQQQQTPAPVGTLAENGVGGGDGSKSTPRRRGGGGAGGRKPVVTPAVPAGADDQDDDIQIVVDKGANSGRRGGARSQRLDSLIISGSELTPEDQRLYKTRENERKRRAAQKSSADKLRELVPGLNEQKSRKAGEGIVMQKAAEYIEELEKRLEESRAKEQERAHETQRQQQNRSASEEPTWGSSGWTDIFKALVRNLVILSKAVIIANFYHNQTQKMVTGSLQGPPRVLPININELKPTYHGMSEALHRQVYSLVQRELRKSGRSSAAGGTGSQQGQHLIQSNPPAAGNVGNNGPGVPSQSSGFIPLSLAQIKREPGESTQQSVMTAPTPEMVRLNSSGTICTREQLERIQAQRMHSRMIHVQRFISPPAQGGTSGFAGGQSQGRIGEGDGSSPSGVVAVRNVSGSGGKQQVVLSRQYGPGMTNNAGMQGLLIRCPDGSYVRTQALGASRAGGEQRACSQQQAAVAVTGGGAQQDRITTSMGLINLKQEVDDEMESNAISVVATLPEAGGQRFFGDVLGASSSRMSGSAMNQECEYGLANIKSEPVDEEELEQDSGTPGSLMSVSQVQPRRDFGDEGERCSELSLIKQEVMMESDEEENYQEYDDDEEEEDNDQDEGPEAVERPGGSQLPLPGWKGPLAMGPRSPSPIDDDEEFAKFGGPGSRVQVENGPGTNSAGAGGSSSNQAIVVQDEEYQVMMMRQIQYHERQVLEHDRLFMEDKRFKTDYLRGASYGEKLLELQTTVARVWDKVHEERVELDRKDEEERMERIRKKAEEKAAKKRRRDDDYDYSNKRGHRRGRHGSGGT